ncbi:hypothetical protein AVEN_37140-1 [Araneus ventricosus]|uniref:Uncharacterized protein n=1 Tax=Araneus ventricosus TaxID=182803 RepID=A0A4Y2HB33_ARAVE|nr:hypothetical protein AVEN_37140-1 [Araneus ventricosus]
MQKDSGILASSALFQISSDVSRWLLSTHVATQIAILVCSKFSADLHCISASLQQISHDKSASVKQVCSKLTQASKSPWDELAASLHCKL